MLYVVETKYVGPDREQHLNDHAFEVRDEPARGNTDNQQVITNGWCGTTNDWATYAHREFATMQSARAEVERQTGGDYRLDADQDGEFIERYLSGRLYQMNTEETQMFCQPACDDITAETTDEQIIALVSSCAESAEAEFGSRVSRDAAYELLSEARYDCIDALQADIDG